MINALHLIWIIPLSMLAGAFCMALLATNNLKWKRGNLWQTKRTV